MIQNRQREVRVRLISCKQFLARAKKSLGLEKIEIGICFVSRSQIARWNRAYRRKNKPTDVLSFPPKTKKSVRRSIHSTHKQEVPFLGDIAISPAVAKRNASTSGRSFQDELHILILHGLLHLMGYDHEKDTGEMNRLEAKLRARLGLN
ncbi:MAG: rRNA maturation RNase YbeY [Acidobacteria bacterium]|nr:rRNA maturation RNase YbeY [Acidobacteriota bacterium]